jgi:hypothetical protein
MPMKRAILIWMIWAILLTGCQRTEPTATDLLAKVLSSQETPQVEIYFHGAMLSDSGYLSNETEETLYQGQSPKTLSDEFAIALCQGDQVYEIHIFHGLDAEKAEQIEHILSRRQTVLQKQENYLGKRIKRGLFKSSTNKLVNADINGAVGMLRKGNAISDA